MELRSRGDAAGIDGALASLIIGGEYKRMKMWKWLVALIAMLVVVGVSVLFSVQEGVESEEEQFAHMCNGCKDPIPNTAGCQEWCAPIRRNITGKCRGVDNERTIISGMG